jgi:hypothetical protein
MKRVGSLVHEPATGRVGEIAMLEVAFGQALVRFGDGIMLWRSLDALQSLEPRETESQ